MISEKTDVENEVDRAHLKHLEDEREWEHRINRDNEDYAKTKQKLAIVFPLMRPAQPIEYAQWVIEHIKRGGKITHWYDYDMPRTFVAKFPFEIPAGVCGALSFNIIAPEGIEVTHEGFDHCHVFDTNYNSDFVPMYNDVRGYVK